ncbi:MAG: sugar phosphate isomerase/epimerase family protein [Desulfuromonadales bacterium]|nr:sugar phosphate isomerase/epimerase family protein [Desulfuromonadales bacterium]
MGNVLHVHLPLRALKKRLRWLIRNRFQPEVACQGNELERIDHSALRALGSRLADETLQLTIHAPFFDLNPGSHDPAIEMITRRRFHQTLDVAESLQASLIVFHPGFDRWRYDRQPDLWHEQSLKFWPPLIQRAAAINCQLVLENIYEDTPETLATLLDQLDSPWLGHCFDVGHWNLFSPVSLGDWFARLGHHTRHIHLHDNGGKRDEHLPIGQGNIDFSELFQQIGRLHAAPSLTLEAHTLRELTRSLAAVQPYLEALNR